MLNIKVLQINPQHMFRSVLFIFTAILLSIFSLAAQSCPDIQGFTMMGSLNGHSYYLSNANHSWENANQLAQQAGGYLVSMNSQEENEFVRQRIGANMVFIGLTDKNNEGNVKWTNGEGVTINLGNQNTKDNDYGVMNFWDGSWTFGGVWEKRKFVMEMECGVSPPANTSPVQVFIFAGQSNMSGGGITSELDPSMKIVPSNATVNIHFYGYDYTDLSPGNFGPEVRFIHEITNANPSQKFLFIKYAWGGQGMNQWVPGSQHYNTLKNKVYQALGNLNLDYELAAFLWMQGETDAFSPIEADLYGARLNTMITSLRNELGTPDLPAIIGQVDPPNACCVATVQSAVSDFVANDDQASVVWTHGVERNWNDPIHYNTAGQLDLGQRFYAAYQTMEPKGFKLLCPENIVKALGQGEAQTTISWVINNITSDCNGQSDVQTMQIQGPASGSNFAIGHYDVTYAATDDCQNKDSCSFNIEVQEHTTCPTQLDGFVKLDDYNGHRYFLAEKPMSWENAQENALGNNGYLAVMNSNDENKMLKNLLNDQMVFIGLSDHETEGQLQWSDGSPFELDLTYENNDNNDFAVMNFWEGSWQMVNKWVEKPFIIELECQDPTFMATLEQNVLAAYPNPAKHTIHFYANASRDGEANYHIFDESGFLYLSEKRNLLKGDNTLSINIETLPTGRYTLQKKGSNASVLFVKF